MAHIMQLRASHALRGQAGATAVVPETLEPSLQLASAVLSQLNMPPDDVQEAIQEFRRAHMGELQVCCCDLQQAMRGFRGSGCWPESLYQPLVIFVRTSVHIYI